MYPWFGKGSFKYHRTRTIRSTHSNKVSTNENPHPSNTVNLVITHKPASIANPPTIALTRRHTRTVPLITHTTAAPAKKTNISAKT